MMLRIIDPVTISKGKASFKLDQKLSIDPTLFLKVTNSSSYSFVEKAIAKDRKIIFIAKTISK